MESQFKLFERLDKKGISQPPADIPSLQECERLETTYKDNLRFINRVKSQAQLPNEVLDRLQSQV